MTEASCQAKKTADGDVWRFKMALLGAIGEGGHGKPPGSSEQAHVGADVREHVKRLEWKARYDESTKLFDEDLQNN